MSTSSAIAEMVSSDVLASHLQEIIVEYASYKKQYRRTEPREAVSIPVEAIALDEDHQPAAEPFYMVTRDMSASGTGMFHTESISCKYLRLLFSSPVSLETFGVTARVEHCTPCGKYFIVGCTFLTDRR